MFVGCKTEKEDVHEIILVDDDMNEIGRVILQIEPIPLSMMANRKYLTQFR